MRRAHGGRRKMTLGERRPLSRPPCARELSLAALFLAVTTLLALGPILFSGGGRVFSNEDADLARQFVHWRAFGFGEMRHGHLALWNPHIFSGAPFFGGFQSALLYPPNWLYLVLPLAAAINWGIALHVFFAGFFMYLWMRGRRLRPLACGLAALVFQFCGPHFPHIDAGHLPNLCAIPWGPLVLLAIDQWLERRTPGWILLGGGATAMQILAGHPQYVFYTGVAAGLYSALRLVWTPRRWSAAAGLACMPAVAVALSAVQLLEGFHAGGQSVRSHGITFDFAALFSFPPENFITAIVPGFFGDLTTHPYWGRCALWEMSLFFGVTGLVLAGYGMLRGERLSRNIALFMTAVLLLLATGAHTPLFYWLYVHVPGFDKFRGLSKFTYPAVLFLISLAASGFDTLLNERRPPRALIAFSLGLGLAVGLAAVFLMPSGGPGDVPRPWRHWIRTEFNTGETQIAYHTIEDVAFQRAAARFATKNALGSAGTLVLLALVLAAARRLPAVLGLVPAIALAELLTFAHSTLQSFPLADAQTSPATDYLAEHPANPSRILNLEEPNIAMSIGAFDLWGYDPGVPRRYAEWMADSQGVDPDQFNEDLLFTQSPPLYGTLLRCRYLLREESTMPANGGQLPVQVYPPKDVSPRLLLVSDVRVIHDRDSIFAAMREPDFDPRRTVILEAAPDPAPAPGNTPAGVAKVVAETTDSLTLDADLTRAAVLLVTDTYCTGWTAHVEPGSNPVRGNYPVMPGDYCLRAIPLPAGHHRLTLVYRPLAFVAGAWISSVALILYLAAASGLSRTRRMPFPPDVPPTPARGSP